MQYECIEKSKHFFIGQIIDVDTYNRLFPQYKEHFKDNYDDESIGEQITRNQVKDDDLNE